MANNFEQKTQTVQQQLEAWREAREYIRSGFNHATFSGYLALVQALEIATNGERQALADIDAVEAGAAISNLKD